LMDESRLSALSMSTTLVMVEPMSTPAKYKQTSW
jgi:hypothetical protein